jgi:hypothetical protein
MDSAWCYDGVLFCLCLLLYAVKIFRRREDHSPQATPILAIESAACSSGGSKQERSAALSFAYSEPELGRVCSRESAQGGLFTLSIRLLEPFGCTTLQFLAWASGQAQLTNFLLLLDHMEIWL